MTKQISVTELKSRLAAGEHPTILDVRQPEEREEFALDNTMFIPLGDLPERVGELERFRNSELIIYCRSGNRSGQACMFLELSGFAHVVNLTGGLLAWVKR